MASLRGRPGETLERLLPARVRGRYLLRPAPSGAGVEPLIVGFHGYAENADRMLEALELLPGARRWSLAAVQALHPFYNPRSGEVVASWMTRLDREAAIADNVAYVAAALVEMLDEVGAGAPLILVGFSQGTAMAYRTAALSGLSCTGLIALAGDVPPELAELDLSRFPPVLIGCGTGDSLYTPDKLEGDLELLSGKGAGVETRLIAGGHEWTEEFRRVCARFVQRVAGA